VKGWAVSLPVSNAAKFYRDAWDRRSSEELHTLAHIKRFMECLTGDPGFRKKLADNFNGDLRAVAEEYGIDADPALMLPLFSTAHMKYRFTDEGTQWPLAKLWDAYMQDILQHRDMLRQLGDTSKNNPRFHNWRQRQMARCYSELGSMAPAITHPIIGLELSEGCSVGCWFCGISADKFKGYWPYTESNATLWRDVLAEVADVFGTGAQTGFCYWGTDPSDNPDYPRFIEDYYEVVGALPQTTTAAPMKNVAWTRQVLALFNKHRFVCNRFSLLTLKAMQQVHREFTPQEIFGVELVLQNKEAIVGKANAGRAMERKHRMEKGGKTARLAMLDSDQSTIACVSGFLVNMVTRTVRLVTPTRSSERWPLGYRIYAEATFSTAAEFRAIIDDMIEAHMPEDLSGDDILAFRPDLPYNQLADGFELSGAGGTKYTMHSDVIGAAYLGKLIRSGDRTASDIIAAMVRSGSDIFQVAAYLRRLFDLGVFDDDPISGKITKRELRAVS
jgi:radical SAM family RiPP maturation amino acid epimerase